MINQHTAQKQILINLIGTQRKKIQCKNTKVNREKKNTLEDKPIYENC